MTARPVRRATARDAAAIGAISVAGWRAAYRGLVPDAILDGLSVERRTAGWLRAIDGDAERAPTSVWVAETAEDGVVGFAAAGPGRDESAPPPDGAGEVYAIYVAPHATGRGHGAALLAHAVADLEARGLSPVVLWVFEANEAARRFYAAAGFAPDGARFTIDFDGTTVDEVRYRRERRTIAP